MNGERDASAAAGGLSGSGRSATGGAASAAAASPSSTDSGAVRGARFVGLRECERCHPAATARWRGSHHDLAMQEATETTVLGDFNNTTFTHFGVTSTFSRRDGKYFVRTDGPDGKLHEYEIAYAFGIDPLQQYLIAFPGGRYQALNVCWDTRPRKEGGQRWFHLYPKEEVAHDDPLHWTGPYQNWNFMCAECHSTDVHKNYRADENRYETSWSEIDVSCEACHGPGSVHAAWGDAVKAGRIPKDDPDNGLVFDLGGSDRGVWELDMTTGIARRSRPRVSRTEVETCARCHARRSVVAADYVYGQPLMQTHRPTLLDEGLYFCDGQIEDEVYEYGSFLQSRMYAAGVTCTDCHDPHSLALRVSADVACSRCHLQERFATTAHHFHRPLSTGASCIACHMPTRNYMVVHARHDHSFRIPRPDLSISLGTPNACTACHKDKTDRWAADAALKWWGPRIRSKPQGGEAIHAGREDLAGAPAALRDLVLDPGAPAIRRATAASLLLAQGRAGRREIAAIETALGDPDPLVRYGALEAAQDLPPDVRLRLVAPLLRDPILTVRIQAARVLAPLQAQSVDPAVRRDLEAGIAEYERAQHVDDDRGEAHLNLGSLAAERGEFDRAEREYRKAIALAPALGAAYVNLADLGRVRGREEEAERVLRQGLAASPRDPGIHHALGLTLVRMKRLPEALVELEQAARIPPERPHYVYVYAVALDASGRTRRAIEVLQRAHEQHTGDREILIALASFSSRIGDRASAAAYAKQLVDLDPEDPEARALASSIGGL
jgi:Flp pilus assembly protein TadD